MANPMLTQLKSVFGQIPRVVQPKATALASRVAQPQPTAMALRPAVSSYDQYMAQYQQNMAALQRQLEALQYQLNQPKPTFGRTIEEFRGQAQGETNPYYNKMLQTYLADMQIQRQRERENFQETQKAVGTEKQYTAEDYAKTMEGIGQQQQTAGVTGGLAREQELAGLAGAGLTFSGQRKRTEELRQAQARLETIGYKTGREAAGTTKGRALYAAGEKERLGKINLDRALKDIQLSEVRKGEEVEQAKLTEVARQQQYLYDIAYQNWRAKTPGAW